MKFSSGIALLFIVFLLAPFTFGFTPGRGEPSAGAGCSTASLESYAPDVLDGSREVVRILRLKHPDKAQQLEEYASDAESFYQGWQRNKLDGLATLPALLKSFKDTVVPLLDPNNTALQLAASGVDFGLRKFARYWQDHKDSVQQSPPQAAMAKATATAKGINLESADKTVEEFLRTPKIEKPKQ